MKTKKFFTTLGLAVALSAPILAGCTVKGSSGSQGGTSEEPIKYLVSYRTSEDYTVTGIDTNGYVAGETVSFAVAVTDAENKEIASVKYDNTTITMGEDSKYSFAMPEKNVQLSIALKDILKYGLSYTGTPKVDEEITFSLKLGNDPVADDFVIEGKTDADRAKISVREGNIVKCLAEGDCTLVAKVKNEVKAEIKVTIAKSDLVAIKAALDAAIKEVPFNGKAGAASAKTTSDFTVGGKIVSISNGKSASETQFDATVIIDDGTALFPLVVYGQASKWSLALGDSCKVTCKMTNYYGILEGISTKSTADKQTSLYPDDLVKTNATYTTSASVEANAATLDAYYNTCKTNGTSGATAYTEVKAWSFTGKNAKIGDTTRLVYSDGKADNAGAVAVVSTTSCKADETLDRVLTVKGYMLGGNTSKKNLTFHVLEQQTLAATGVKINEKDAGVTVPLNNTAQLTYTLLPEGATAGKVEWTSSDTSKVTVDNNGLVKGVAEGEATITVKVDEKYTDTCKVTVSGALNHATAVALDKTTAEVKRGGTLTLNATITAENAEKPCTDEVVWASSNEQVATVANGVVTAVANGTANITVTVNGKSASCAVTVRDQNIADLAHAVVGDEVDVYGYVTGFYQASAFGYWIADGANALAINAKPTADMEVGKIVHVVGTVSAFHGAKQVAQTSAEVVDSKDGLTAPTKLEIGAETVLDETQQGRLASVTGTVKSVNQTAATYGTTNVTYQIAIDDTHTVKVYLHKSNPSQANYEDFFNKVKTGKTVTVEGFVTANKSNVTDFTTLTAADYQLVNPVCTASNTVNPTGIAMDAAMQIEKGKSAKVNATLEPAGADGAISYAIASESGKVTISDAGVVTVAADATTGETATVTATCGEFSATCVITVIDAASKTELTFGDNGNAKNTANTGYANMYDVTIDGFTWSIPGNQSLAYGLKIGGKFSTADKFFFTKTVMSSVSKVEITHGSKDAAITVNSLTLTVYATAEDAAAGTNPVSTVQGEFVDQGVTTFAKPADANWTNCFLRVNYNMTSSAASSNKGAVITKISVSF